MKRGGPLPRRSPLARGPGPRRRTPLRATGSKADRERADLQLFRDVLRDRVWCDAIGIIDADTKLPVCGTFGRHVGEHAHHVWPEDRDCGVHDPGRGKWLCAAAHRWTHANPAKAAVARLLRPSAPR